MKLKRISVKNFRCFKNLDVIFDERLTVLVAENGGGKTSILDATAYALSRILTRMPGVNGTNLRPDDITVHGKNIKAAFVSIEAETTDNIIWSRLLKRDQTTQTATETPDAPGDKFLFAFLDPLIHNRVEGKDTALPMIAYYGAHRAVLEIPQRHRNFKKDFCPFDGLMNALEPTTRFKELFEWFYAQEREYLEHLDQVLNSEIQRGNKQGVQIDGALLKPVLENPAYLAVKALRQAIEAVIPGFSGPRIKTRPLRMFIERTMPDGTKQQLSLQMLSDGYRTMLAMVMDFARRMAQTNPHLKNPLEANAILLIDEIDLHLHPRWQQTVLHDMMRAFPNTQFIIASHSPQVLSTVPMKSIRIIKGEVLYSAPAGTDGAEAQRILEGVFQVPPRPDTEMARLLDGYLRLVEQRKWETPEALELRAKLDQWSQGQEPRLLEADLQIENLKWEMKK